MSKQATTNSTVWTAPPVLDARNTRSASRTTLGQLPRASASGAIGNWTVVPATMVIGALPEPVYLPESRALRFWVRVGHAVVGAVVRDTTLRDRYAPRAGEANGLETYLRNAPEIDAAVRRKVAQGYVDTVFIDTDDLQVYP